MLNRKRSETSARRPYDQVRQSGNGLRFRVMLLLGLGYLFVRQAQIDDCRREGGSRLVCANATDYAVLTAQPWA
jgi:hypothetical protein